MSNQESKSLKKLLAAYGKAEGELIRYRNEHFPVGTRFVCNITELEFTVKKGSLYADQVMTDRGHHQFYNVRKL